MGLDQRARHAFAYAQQLVPCPKDADKRRLRKLRQVDGHAVAQLALRSLIRGDSRHLWQHQPRVQ